MSGDIQNRQAVTSQTGERSFSFAPVPLLHPGALTPAMGLEPSWYKPVGQLFINLVRMVVVPLVLTTLVAGAASVGDVSKLGRVAGKTLAYYLVTTAVAVVIGLVLANIFQPAAYCCWALMKAPISTA